MIIEIRVAGAQASGKSTIVRLIARSLKAVGTRVLVIEGDELDRARAKATRMDRLNRDVDAAQVVIITEQRDVSR